MKRRIFDKSKLNSDLSVTIWGLDPFGRKAWITFEPMPPGQHGVFWKVGNGSNAEYVPIDWRIAFLCFLHNIFLKHKNFRLYVYEHLGALRFTGFDGYAISSSPWPPYITTGQMWEIIKELTMETDECIPYIEIPCCSPVQSIEGGLSRSIQICPGYPNSTILDVSIKYSKFDIYKEGYELVNGELLDRIFPVGPQGMLSWQYRMSKILGTQYSKIVVWPEDEKDKSVLTQKFYDHTLVDRLGEISLFSFYKLPKCTVLSKQAGHGHALTMVKNLGAIMSNPKWHFP